MDKIKNDLPISKKIVFLMVILFLILCMPINGIRVFADKFDTLQNRLEWYKSKHPIPYDRVDYDKGECNEVVGYLGYLTWTAGEGQQIYGCEPGQTCNIRGTIGETTDKTIDLPDEIDSDPPDDYVFSVFGFLRCTEPVLRIEPDKEVMVVNEMIAIKVYLKCGTDVCPGQPVILKVVSGPGELDLPELSSDDINMLRDKGYFFQGDIIITKTTAVSLGDTAEAMLYATDVGTIEIKATYESCQSIITETAIVDVRQQIVMAVIESTTGACSVYPFSYTLSMEFAGVWETPFDEKTFGKEGAARLTKLINRAIMPPELFAVARGKEAVLLARLMPQESSLKVISFKCNDPENKNSPPATHFPRSPAEAHYSEAAVEIWLIEETVYFVRGGIEGIGWYFEGEQDDPGGANPAGGSFGDMMPYLEIPLKKLLRSEPVEIRKEHSGSYGELWSWTTHWTIKITTE